MNFQMLLARSIFLRRDSYLLVLEIKQYIQMSKCEQKIYVPVFHIQPGYDDLNPDWRLSTEKRKKIKGELYDV